MKKILLMMTLLPALLLGCHGNVDPESTGAENGGNENSGNGSIELVGPITLYTDRDIIMADDAYTAKLKVLLMDKSGVEHDVTPYVEIYCNAGDAPVENTDFRTSDEGVYEFYAVHGFEISNTVTVRAVKGVPELPADSDTGADGFRHRMLLLQHTGNECPNCPALMETLKLLADDGEYNSLYHHVASHSYNTSDAAYSSAAASLSKELGVHYYPWLTFNLSTENGYTLGEIKDAIDRLHKEEAEAGICAAASKVGNSIYVNVGIRSAVESKYRVAAWLLEDNIRSVQSGANASWQNMHENCLRAMAGSTKNESIYGKSIGKVDQNAAYEFITAIDDVESDWNEDNCKVMIILVSGEDFKLVNCVVCPLGGKVAYAYN